MNVDRTVAADAAGSAAGDIDGSNTIVGGDGPDRFFVGWGNDFVSGGGGNDSIEVDPDFFNTSIPGRDDDVANGEGGDDTIQGGTGFDVLSGGVGDDLIKTWYSFHEPLLVDTLDGGEGNDVLSIGITGAGAVLEADGDSLNLWIDGNVAARIDGVENIDFTAIYLLSSPGNLAQSVAAGGGNDTITTAEGDDTLSGGDGADVIDAGDGLDHVDGGAGDDNLRLVMGGEDVASLGDGDDVLMLSSWSNPYYIARPPDEVGRYDGGSGADVLAVDLRELELDKIFADGSVIRANGQVIARTANFESLLINGDPLASIFVSGLQGDDTVFGSSIKDSISGGAGDDLLRGGGGADAIDGGDGDDVIAIEVDNKADVLAGGHGVDVLNFSFYSDSIQMTGRLGRGGEIIRNGEHVATLSGFESVVINGSAQVSGAPTRLMGGSGDDSISVEGGRLRIDTGAGDDHVSLSLDHSKDRIDLGDGVDVLSINGFGRTQPMLMTGAIEDIAISFGGSNAMMVKGAERLEISATDADDDLFGGDLADAISTGRGADSVEAGAGDDKITIKLDDRLDVIDGGAGRDTLDVSSVDDLLKIRVTSADSGVQVRSGRSVVLEASSIEAISITATSGNDALQGLDANDSLNGGSGDDSLNGGGGSDTLNSGAGIDVLHGGSGDDLLIVEPEFIGASSKEIDGGAGSDTVHFDNYGHSLHIYLSDHSKVQYSLE